MRRLKQRRFLLYLATLSLVVVGSYAYYSLHHLHLDLSGLAVLFSRLAPLARVAAVNASPCGPPVELTTTGEQQMERMALYVATVIDQYQSTFGMMPDKINDLNKLPSFANANRLNGLEFTKSCYLRVSRGGSYALGCGVARPSSSNIDAFFGRSEKVRGFYGVSGIEILYFPRPGCP